MVTTITDLPTTPSRSDSPEAFNTNMIAWVAALPTRRTEMNAQAAELDDLAEDAQAAVLDALTGTNAAVWVSGTSYTEGVKVWSPVNYKTYRRKSTGGGTTDPSSDSTNWALIAGTGNVKITATQTLENKTLTDPILDGGMTHDIYAITDGASVDIDPANGDWQTWTLGADRTPTAANFENGDSVILYLADGASAYTPTWTIVTSWLDDFTPVLPTSGYAKIKLWMMGGLIYGAWLGNL